jgi:hypothetical protein
MRRNILLIEPNYRNKYPPIGLMKIATYHRLKGDSVQFFKGDITAFTWKIKTENALKLLRKIDKKLNWNDHYSTIENYVKSKHLIYLNQILEYSKVKKRSAVEEALRIAAKDLPTDRWARIYVTTLFTFYWDITVKTIHFAKKLVDSTEKLFVGGVMASLLKNEIIAETGIVPFTGLLDKPGMLDSGDDHIVDELPLDYSILGETDYQYPTQSAYFTYMTKGCTRKCTFCSVPKLEPTYKNKIDAISNFIVTKERFGEQRHLMLMDNNVLASQKFPEIIQEIKEMGFYSGATLEEPDHLAIAVQNLRDGFNDKVYLPRAYKLILKIERRLKKESKLIFKEILQQHNFIEKGQTDKRVVLKVYKKIKPMYEKARFKPISARFVDFNQGTDARYVTEENMKLMSKIPIRPLRIAFDHLAIKDIYQNAVRLAAKYGIKDLSNYILYNFQDKPEHFYERLKINVDLGKELGVTIFSFPMKYIPLFGEEAKHRRHIGTHWNKKFIRAIQSILNVTKGIVAPGYDFFQMAFGENIDEFMEILWMPETYIMNRRFFQANGMIAEWKQDFEALDDLVKVQAREIIKESNFDNALKETDNHKLLRLISHYQFTKSDKSLILKNIKKLRAKYNRLIRTDSFINLTLTHDFDSGKRQPLA